MLIASGDEPAARTRCCSTSRDEWPPFFARFERLLEIVAADEADKAARRARATRFYRDRGYEIRTNDDRGRAPQ